MNILCSQLVRKNKEQRSESRIIKRLSEISLGEIESGGQFPIASFRFSEEAGW
jgi:hypothetical protein